MTEAKKETGDNDFLEPGINDPVMQRLLQAVEMSYAARRQYWPHYTWSAQTSRSKVLSEQSETLSKILPGFTTDDLNNRLSDIFHKINATFYHLQVLKRAEEIAIELGTMMATAPHPGMEGQVGVAGTHFEPIVYEYESLLVDARSTLDFLAMFISKSQKRNEDSIFKLLNYWKKGEILSETENKIKAFILEQKNKDFIERFGNTKKGKSRRNHAVHEGALDTGTINIPINSPQSPILKSKALGVGETPLGKGRYQAQDLQDYCEETFYSLADIVLGTLEIALNTKFEKGVKSSCQEVLMQKMRAEGHIS